MNTENSFSFDPALMEAEGLQGELVYDHKMLWRANLYIDGPTGDEVVDWNESHPWNAPLTENEWNKDNDGNLGEGDQVVDLTDYPWTRYYAGAGTWFDETDTTVRALLPYTKGGSDSPFSMIEKLESQRILLEYYMKHPDLENNNYTGGGPNTTWSEPVAPGSFESPFLADNTDNWNNYLGTGYQLTINATMTYPYRPGYSSVESFQGNYKSAQVEQSIGADCSGFIQRCASYVNSPYLSGGSVANPSDKSITQLVSTEIWSGDNRSGSKNRLEGVAGIVDASYPITDRKMLVPGDIITMNGHVVIIKYIFSDYTDQITDDEIIVIEAAGTGTAWTINSVRTFFDLTEIPEYGTPIFRRMYINE